MRLNNVINKIVYPDENGTAIWYKKNRYDIVVENKTYFIYNYQVIKLLEILIELEEKQK